MYGEIDILLNNLEAHFERTEDDLDTHISFITKPKHPFYPNEIKILNSGTSSSNLFNSAIVPFLKNFVHSMERGVKNGNPVQITKEIVDGIQELSKADLSLDIDNASKGMNLTLSLFAYQKLIAITSIWSQEGMYF